MKKIKNLFNNYDPVPLLVLTFALVCCIISACDSDDRRRKELNVSRKNYCVEVCESLGLELEVISLNTYDIRVECYCTVQKSER